MRVAAAFEAATADRAATITAMTGGALSLSG
jgi:hypothetical protein